MRIGERRRNNRYDCTHPVRYAYGDALPRLGLLYDISTGGVLLATHQPVPDGVRMTLSLHDPRSRAPIELHGTVRHRASDRAYGIAFVELAPEALELVNYLLTVAASIAPG